MLLRPIASHFVYCHAKTNTHVVVSCPYSYPLLFAFSHALILKGSLLIHMLFVPIILGTCSSPLLGNVKSEY